MPSCKHATNRCAWLPQGSTTVCGKNSYGKFCGVHAMFAKLGKLDGPRGCLGCGKGVRGRYQICMDCGGHQYRSVVNQCKKMSRTPPTIEEFLHYRASTKSI